MSAEFWWIRSNWKNLNFLDKYDSQDINNMVNFQINYRNKYADTLCPVCETVGVEDSQEHVMECVKLLKNKLVHL